VADYWPEFAQASKASITVRQLLSHQAGLPALDAPLTVHDLAGRTKLSAALAAHPRVEARRQTRLSRRHTRLV
jgi:CubicO group peptidase (beta-lactamase class C family)